MKRSLEIDATRTILNLLIVVYHAGFYEMWLAAGPVEGGIIHTLNRMEWTLPSLFLLSGYLMMKGFSYQTFKEKFWHRIKRLAAPLYLINWAILVGVGIASCFGLVHDPKYNLHWAITRFFCVAEGCGIHSLWYVRTLLIFTLLSPIIYWFISHPTRRYIAIGGAILWCLMSTILGLDVPLSMIVPSYSILIFLLGGVLALTNREICDFARRHGLLAALMWGLSIFIIRFYHVGWNNGLLATMQCLFWFVFAGWFSVLMKYKWFAFLCESAFFVYVFHVDVNGHLGPLLLPLWKMTSSALGSFPGFQLLSLGVTFIIDLCCSCLVYAGLKKCCPLAARVLNGRL